MEEQDDERKGFIEGRLILVVLVLFIVIGIVLAFAALALYPDVIVHEDRVNATSEFTSSDRIELEPETYEVWTSTSFWGIFNLDEPEVYVNSTTGEPIDVAYVNNGDDRNIKGNNCQHFATFVIEDSGEYDIIIIAGVLSMDFTGSTEVYILEERPAAYGIMIWTGILLVIAGLLGLIALAFIRYSAGEAERAKKKREQAPPMPYPPQGYPPQGYQQYPQQPYQQQPYQQPPYQQPPYQQPPYGYYPPPQQQPPPGYPPYPPPQQAPPSSPPTPPSPPPPPPPLPPPTPPRPRPPQ